MYSYHIKKSERKKFHRLFGWLKLAVTIFFVGSFLAILSLRWIHPFTSAFMVRKQIESWFSNEQDFDLRYNWVDYMQISPYIKMAAITSEDQTFAKHWGFAFKQIKNAITNYLHGDELRGASTISQQTAKNLFLYPTQNFFRKGLEAYFTLLLELLLSKERILTIYLNIAAFGEGIYGVKAAAQRYFNTKPARLNKAQSALMVTALPNPDEYNLAAPSSYMYQRQNWIMRYMSKLGGNSYLKRL